MENAKKESSSESTFDQSILEDEISDDENCLRPGEKK